MWTSSFAELAKKAQEASEEGLSSIRSPNALPSIFNLDNMMASEDTKKNLNKNADLDRDLNIDIDDKNLEKTQPTKNSVTEILASNVNDDEEVQDETKLPIEDSAPAVVPTKPDMMNIFSTPSPPETNISAQKDEVETGSREVDTCLQPIPFNGNFIQSEENTAPSLAEEQIDLSHQEKEESSADLMHPMPVSSQDDNNIVDSDALAQQGLHDENDCGGISDSGEIDGIKDEESIGKPSLEKDEDEPTEQSIISSEENPLIVDDRFSLGGESDEEELEKELFEDEQLAYDSETSNKEEEEAEVEVEVEICVEREEKEIDLEQCNEDKKAEEEKTQSKEEEVEVEAFAEKKEEEIDLIEGDEDENPEENEETENNCIEKENEELAEESNNEVTEGGTFENKENVEEIENNLDSENDEEIYEDEEVDETIENELSLEEDQLYADDGENDDTSEAINEDFDHNEESILEEEDKEDEERHLGEEDDSEQIEIQQPLLESCDSSQIDVNSASSTGKNEADLGEDNAFPSQGSETGLKEEVFEEGEESKENQLQAEDCTNIDENNDEETNAPTQGDGMASVPQFAIEKFMSQLERLHAEHEIELQEMESKHRVHVEELQQNVEELQQKRQPSKTEEIASNDQYLAQLRTLERDYNKQLKEKETQVEELSKKNESMETMVKNFMKKEDAFEKTQNEKNGMMAKMDEKTAQIEKLKTALADSEANLEASNEAFSTLKSRVKVVATELKERRAECRGLNATVVELTSGKASLDVMNGELEAKLTKQLKMNDAKNERIEKLQSEVAELQEELKDKEKALVTKGSIGDKALSAYKKKAQASLAAANARAAAANLAREEAEIDASNARSETENATNIAQLAVADKEDVVTRSLEEVQVVMDQNEALQRECSGLMDKLATERKTHTAALNDAEEWNKMKEGLLNELNEKEKQIKQEIEKRASLEQDVSVGVIKNKSLQEEISSLKEELDKSVSAAFLARQKQIEESEQADKLNSNANLVAESFGKSESDGTVIMLQQELKDANDAIKELKDALGKLLMENPSLSEKINEMDSLNENGFSYLATEHEDLKSAVNSSTAQSDSDNTPLFFAIQKQAELQTARDEISRLAALLGDAESSKVEAYEAMEAMRKEKDDAESRLKRFKKLGPANETRHGPGLSYSSNGHSTWRNPVNGLGQHSQLPSKSGEDVLMSSQSDSTVSLEYLKNIILSYLNAKSLNEKKALVPVIAAVLELTSVEQAQAMENVEKSANIEGAGTSLLESIQSKGVVNGLFG